MQASPTQLIASRRRSHPVRVAGVAVGGGAPIVVQSMTNTDTADIEGTVAQVAALARAGSELVRITVDRDEAAKAVPHIRDRLAQKGVIAPLVGDFHYNGHTLLADHPAAAEALDKYRINPGNVGYKEKKDRQFGAIIDTALRWKRPVRIGVNWGSLDQDLLTRLMDENARSDAPKDARAVMHEAIVQSALISAQRAEELGLTAGDIILSAKVSAVQDLVSVYSMLAARSDYALHVGLTEAGMGSKGIVASTAGIGLLLQAGIGDTIRVSLTPEPGGDRTLEVKVAQEILQSMGLRSFVPVVTACPGCGRTTSTVFQELARRVQDMISERMPEWRKRYPGVETLNFAVMGCIVNGPGESKQADIGISLPGTGESPAAPVFVDGKKMTTLRGPNIAAEFQQIVEDYIERRFGGSDPATDPAPAQETYGLRRDRSIRGTDNDKNSPCRAARASLSALLLFSPDAQAQGYPTPTACFSRPPAAGIAIATASSPATSGRPTPPTCSTAPTPITTTALTAPSTQSSSPPTVCSRRSSSVTTTPTATAKSSAPSSSTNQTAPSRCSTRATSAS